MPFMAVQRGVSSVCVLVAAVVSEQSCCADVTVASEGKEWKASTGMTVFSVARLSILAAQAMPADIMACMSDIRHVLCMLQQVGIFGSPGLSCQQQWNTTLPWCQSKFY